MHTCYIALGSNLGDRARNIFEGVAMLLDRVDARARLSRLYETDPVGHLDQPPFLNGAVELRGALPPPHDLLAICLDVEARLGRVRTIANGPRPLDLDLLLFDDLRISDDGLVIPHPRMHERRFVLEPLADLAPDLCHPALGASVAELLANCR